MKEIKIAIHLTISEEKVKMICDAIQCDREQIVNIISTSLKEDIASTIEDNEEFWEEKVFEIK